MMCRPYKGYPDGSVALTVTSPRPFPIAACPNQVPLSTCASDSRRLISRKFDGSKHRASPGRPPIAPELGALIVRIARENSGWGYDRIVGALANLGHPVSDQTVGNILCRYGIAPAPKRSQKTTWRDFIAADLTVLAGTDF